jgi:hypothetical protein
MTGDSYLMAAVLLGIGTFVVMRSLDRLFIRSIPRDLSRWRDEVERAAIACIHADLHAAETKGHLMQLIGKVPSDFDPSAFLGMQLASAVQRAVLIEAERGGLVRVGTFESVYGVTVEWAMAGNGAPPVATDAAPPADVSPTVPSPAPEPDVEFVNGKCVPRVAQ